MTPNIRPFMESPPDKADRGPGSDPGASALVRDDAEAFMRTMRAVGASPGEALGFAVAAFGQEAMTPAFEDMVHQCGRFEDFRALLDAIAQSSPMAAHQWLVNPSSVRQMGALSGFRGNYLFPGREWVQAFPDGIYPSVLSVERCPNLTHLPTSDYGREGDGRWMGLRAVGLFADECPSLTGMPGRLHVEKTLTLKGCAALASLPSDLKVGGDLSLSGSGIRRLPEGMTVAKDLWLYGCASWDGRIPEEARIGGAIYTDAYPEGVSLIQWRATHPGRGA